MPAITISRRTAETIFLETLDGTIVVEVSQARRGRVKLHLQVPASVRINRGELLCREEQVLAERRDTE